MANNKHLSEETKRKISEPKKGKPGYWLGKSRDQETKDKIGKSHLGLKHTEKSKDKMSKSHLGSKNPKSKKVYMFSLDGTKLASFESITEASKIFNTSRYKIAKSCNNGTIFNKHKWSFSNKIKGI